ncbi:SDR family oxidoreductase [Rhodobacter sp. NTK016B]|uniref:SDR family oxidoreductase n=1 Tax=Rhodobacter sp. NTK016B TaxID=2759676 RepID=UPI001A8C253E|nr:SDR family oxidoreductase [Rhodobacter sp. NTK016B]MBN8291163.1 SDR family oxidoreductase [Rhodobacter sp. NTK016B]
MLDGRHVMVTGAARGLGAVLARAVVEAGARLTIADLAEEEGRALATELQAGFVKVDLSEPDSIASAVASLDGPLDGLVNNGAIATGIGGIGFEDIELDTWDRVMRVNVRGTWLMIRACAPLLRQSGSGRVVNVASDTALWGAPNLLSYTASKGAVMSMTRSLSRELGPDRIGIAAVAPGILTTPSTDYVPEARHKLYEDGRAVPGPQPPEDIAPTVVFLLSEGALTLTGQVLPVNRGFVFT